MRVAVLRSVSPQSRAKIVVRVGSGPCRRPFTTAMPGLLARRVLAIAMKRHRRRQPFQTSLPITPA